eukprot:2172158-Ditylum_brightwellii.AAC.1
MPDNIRRCIETLKELAILQPTIDLIKQENSIDGKLEGTIANIYMNKTEPSWKQAEKKNDVVELSKMIKDIVYKFETQSYSFKAVHNAVQSFYLLYQKDTYTLEQYMETFLNNIDVIKHSNGKVGKYPKFATYIQQLKGNGDLMDVTVMNKSIKQATAAYFAYAFISGASRKKYAKLLKDLSNAYLHGKDKYPKTLVVAHKLLTSWEN